MYISTLSQAFVRNWKSLLGGAALSVTMLTTGCDSMSHTDDGILGGALVGGIFGTLVGAITHHPLAGAAIGAGAGAAIGGVSGAAEDRAEHRQAVAVSQAIADQQSRWPTLQDIATMAAQNQPDQVIINQIRTTGAIYQLTPADLNYLQQNHVSVTVITEMQSTASRPQPSVVVQPSPSVIYASPPPVIVGGYYGYGYRRW